MKSIALYFLLVLYIKASFSIPCRTDNEQYSYEKEILSPHDQNFLNRFSGDEKKQIRELLQKKYYNGRKEEEAMKVNAEVMRSAAKPIFDCAVNHMKNDYQKIFVKLNALNRKLRTLPKIPDCLSESMNLYTRIEYLFHLKLKDKAQTEIRSYFYSMYGFLSPPNSTSSTLLPKNKRNKNSVEDMITSVRNRLQQYFKKELDDDLIVEVAAHVARLRHGAKAYKHTYSSYMEGGPYGNLPLEDCLQRTTISQAWGITDDGIAITNILREIVLEVRDHPIKVVHSKTLDGHPVPLLRINPQACHKANIYYPELYTAEVPV